MGYISDKLKEIFKKIRASKRLMYLVSVSVLVLFCVCLNITYSVWSNSFNDKGANIIINDLEYKMIINDVELSSSVGTSVPTNTIIGDRIILVKAGKTEQFNVFLTSLNNMDTKYEIIYKVCSDVNCTSFIDIPSDIQIAYHVDTPYVSGELKANKSKSIYLVSDNQSENDYYIQIGLNVGYSHNTLALTNQITNDFSPASLDGTLSIIGYVNGVEVETFPTEPNYETGITCLYKNGTVSDARGVFTYSASKGWEVDVFGLNRSLTTCRVDFTEVLKVTYEVLSTRYDCANLQTGSKPNDPLISYTGNCTLIQDTENDDGTHTWRMKLLTSGELTVDGLIYIDAFLVGGGAGGGNGYSSGNGSQFGGCGGAGGYTLTASNIRLDNKSTSYEIVIGAGGSTGNKSGGTTSAFDYLAKGGSSTGGGSGGGAGALEENTGGAGGSYGGNGGSGWVNPTNGQGTTTCEFGEGTTTSCTRGTSFAYAGGGGGGGQYGGSGGTGGGGSGGGYNQYTQIPTAGTANTGGGGGGAGRILDNSKSGGSGIVVIRDVRS